MGSHRFVEADALAAQRQLQGVGHVGLGNHAVQVEPQAGKIGRLNDR